MCHRNHRGADAPLVRERVNIQPKRPHRTRRRIISKENAKARTGIGIERIADSREERGDTTQESQSGSKEGGNHKFSSRNGNRVPFSESEKEEKLRKRGKRFDPDDDFPRAEDTGDPGSEVPREDDMKGGSWSNNRFKGDGSKSNHSSYHQMRKRKIMTSPGRMLRRPLSPRPLLQFLCLESLGLMYMFVGIRELSQSLPVNTPRFTRYANGAE